MFPFLLIGGAILAVILTSSKKASGASGGGETPTEPKKPDGKSDSGKPTEDSVEDLSTEYGPDPILPLTIPQYKGKITNKSQPRDWPGMWANLGSFGANDGKHLGVDFSTEAGTPLVAVGTGRVTSVTKEGDPANKNTLGGTTATIQFEYNGKQYSAYYAHLKDLYVKKGDSVTIGQQIGTVGNTGNARTTGPHCHFELRIDNRHVDPLKNLKAVA